MKNIHTAVYASIILSICAAGIALLVIGEYFPTWMDQGRLLVSAAIAGIVIVPWVYCLWFVRKTTRM